MNTLLINRSKKGRILACIAAVAVAFAMTASPIFAAESGSRTIKDETVYVITNSDGSTSDIIVSDHLKNNSSADTISDVSSLSDIENTKGDEKFSKGDNNILTWSAKGNDIYYQGKTDKEAPVSMSIKYYLDDKEVEGKALEGKSGKVRIVINYENNETANGVKVPFVVLTGMVIGNDCFSNITVSSGKVIDDGEKSFIVGMAAPGVADSLGLSESELGFGSTVEITGDAVEFTPEDLMTIVTNDFFEDIDTGSLSSLDLDGQIKELDNASKELMSGTKELYDGINTLNSKSTKLSTGIGKLNLGTKSIDSGLKESMTGSKNLAAGTSAFSKALNENLGAMKDGVSELAKGSSSLTAGAKNLKSAFDTGDGTAENPGILKVSKSIKDGTADLKQGVDAAKGASLQYLESAKSMLSKLHNEGKLTDDECKSLKDYIDKSISCQNQIDVPASLINGTAGLDSGLNTMYGQIAGDGTEQNPGLVGGAASLESGIGELSSGLDKATAENNSLTSNAQSLAAGADALTEGQSRLSGGAEELAAGMAELEENSGLLINGVAELDIGSKKLNDGMQKFYSEGIEKIVNLYNSKLKGTVNNANAVINAGKSYSTFTELADGMNGSVKFIYRTKVAEE